MIKAGIFLDIENLNRNGGWGLRYRAVKQLVEAQGAVVLRANAYMAVDTKREEEDSLYRKKKIEYRDSVRRQGFHVDLKRVRRYVDEDGQTVLKANTDLDLAVDALLQADNLDYIFLGTGDGDFLRLVQALQNRGKRVDVLSFSNTSSQLRRRADYYFSGYLFPWILPKTDDARKRGFLHRVLEEDGYGFLTLQTGLRFDDVRQDIFLHISDLTKPDGERFTNEEFAQLKTDRTIIEFDLLEDSSADPARVKALNATVFDESKLSRN